MIPYSMGMKINLEQSLVQIGDGCMKILRVDNLNADFVSLTKRLDEELNERYGSQQSMYDKHNIIEPIGTAIVGYHGGKPVACGCFKVIDDRTIEIKRMYVVDECRRRGFSVRVLRELEQWGCDLGYSRAILETGKGQPEAIGLYKKCGYGITDNYGPYKGLENSVCMTKPLKPPFLES